MIFPLFGVKSLVIYAAFFSAGIIDAVCGGGGLLTVPSMMLMGFPSALLFGSNQSSAVLGAVVSMVRYGKSGHIHWRTALVAAPTAFIGAMLGAKLNMLMPIRWLQMLMIVVTPIIAFMVFMKRNFGAENHNEELSSFQRIFYPVMIGLLCGAYQGFYGVGSGMFFMFSFAVLTKLDLIRASGTTKVVAFISIATGAMTYAAAGNVFWPFVLPATVCYMSGSYIGAGLAMKKGAKLIRPLFAVLLVVLMIRLIIELI